ncbi:MAG TPA: hypothetical protein VFX20_01505 [Steroidobacteraceae bacterium]|nr:hypothetical protein [Steroidobacteraceae bacterium]
MRRFSRPRRLAWTDTRKRIACREIPTLEEYVIVAQESVEVTIYRRSEYWLPRVLGSLDASIELVSIGPTLPLAKIYDREAIA